MASTTFNVQGFADIPCDAVTAPGCKPLLWRVDVCARRANDVMLVITTSDGQFRVYDYALGSPNYVSETVYVVAGGVVEVAWVPRPGLFECPDVSPCPNVTNALVRFVASQSSFKSMLDLASTASVYRIPGTGDAPVALNDIPAGTVVVADSIGAL